MKKGILKIDHNGKKIEINYFYSFISKSEITIDREKYLNICQKNCNYYGKNYSCPPYAPKLSDYSKEYTKLFVVMFRIKMSQIDIEDNFERLKTSNNILRQEIEGLMRKLESCNKSKFLSSGPCKLCSRCLAVIDKPCRYPEKMRYSLEALGVDCAHLIQKVFNKKMEWFENGVLPKRTSVIAAIPFDEVNLKKLSKRADALIKSIAK